MPRQRAPAKSSKYYVPKEEYLTVLHFCRQYPDWIKEISNNEKPGVAPSRKHDPARIASIRKKKGVLEMVIHKIAEGMDEWLFLGVCQGLTYPQLKERGIPIGRTQYYEMRQRFYYYLSRII